MALMTPSVLIPAGSAHESRGLWTGFCWHMVGFLARLVTALPMCSTEPLVASSSSLGRVLLPLGVSQDGAQEGAHSGGFSPQVLTLTIADVGRCIGRRVIAWCAPRCCLRSVTSSANSTMQCHGSWCFVAPEHSAMVVSVLLTVTEVEVAMETALDGPPSFYHYSI